MFKWLDGREQPTRWRFRDSYADEYTREPMPHAHVKDAIVDEMSFFNEHVWLGGIAQGCEC